MAKKGTREHSPINWPGHGTDGASDYLTGRAGQMGNKPVVEDITVDGSNMPDLSSASDQQKKTS